MPDNNPPPVFQIQRVYMKGLSLDQPNSPSIFLEDASPAVEVAISTTAVKQAEGIFESTVSVSVTATIQGKLAFTVEAKQAGIFEIRNLPADQLEPVLGIGCPAILYPYLRANVADAVTRGGFPPVHLSEVNFLLFYQQRQQELATQQG